MLVARSFSFTSGRGVIKTDPEKNLKPRVSSSPPPPPKNTTRGFGWRPAAYHKYAPPNAISNDTVSPPKTASVNVPAVDYGNMMHEARFDQENLVMDNVLELESSRTKPMNVPQRKPSREHLRRDISRSLDAFQATQRLDGRRRLIKYDSNAMPASVAALLAVTNIPRQRRQPMSQHKTGSQVPRRMSTQQLMEHWRDEDMFTGTSVDSSPGLDILLSPPDADDLARTQSTESFDDFARARSFSSDSIPSLSADDLSVLSSSLPATPQNGIPRRTSRDKFFTPQSCEDVSEHPLSSSRSKIEEDPEDRPDPKIVEEPEDVSSPATKEGKRSSFKSNLTASIAALASSLRSLSNFASTPYTVPDDHLSSGFFFDSQRIRSEMRPRPLAGPPTAKMRRYLNPSSHHMFSPSDFHQHGRQIEHIDYESLVGSAGVAFGDEGTLIALQDRLPSEAYETSMAEDGVDKSREGTFSEAGRAMHDQQSQNRREIRENGEFLRICVLETNMRRAGKFEGPGRAKIWLPPRRVENHDEELVRVSGYMCPVPRRWIGEIP